MPRRPVPRIIYNKVVGAARVYNLVEILEEYGFLIELKPIESPGVDLWVYLDFQLELVIEVTNWDKRSYMSDEKANSLRNNFREYSCTKLFVCSFKENYENKTEYIDEDVDVLELGFQTQPYYFHPRFDANPDTMRPDDSITRGMVKVKLTRYLLERGLIVGEN